MHPLNQCLKDLKYEIEIFLTHKYQEGSNEDTDPENAEDRTHRILKYSG